MTLAPYQKELIMTGRDYGMLLMLWRRQGRKTTTFAWQALRWMLEHPGCLVTFSTCALALGAELTEREVQMLMSIIDTIKSESNEAIQVETEADKLPWYDVADLFTRNRLEVTIHHDRTTRSRTKIIAANYATARGYSGYVLLDEIGFIRDFKLFFEAVEPIFSSNPNYRLWMATTPPEDDAHFSYELSAYPPGREFIANPRGNWYSNDSGLPVHRVSAADADLAGIKLYDSKTRAVVSPEQHRAKHLDKTAWDRNYGLIFTQGGISAVQLLPLSQAQAAGYELGCRYYCDDLPSIWAESLDPRYETTVGADPATTEKQKSNPFGVAVDQLINGKHVGKMFLRFRSSDPVKCRLILKQICLDIKATGSKLRCLNIDATSERFWAAETRTAIQNESICPVNLIVSSETIEHLNETMTFKTYLGNITIGVIEDKQAAIPPDKETRDDFRLVRRFKGGFDNQLDNAGNHGDLFDAYKLAIYGHLMEVIFIAEAAAVAVGNHSSEAHNTGSTGRMSMKPGHSDGNGSEETKLYT